MKRLYMIQMGLSVFFGILAAEPESRMPNVIYILCDDLGYGEVGFNG